MANCDRPLVITLCTSRKRVEPKILASKLPRGDQAVVSAAWLTAIEKATPDTRARELYSGRGFRDARRAAEQLNADLAIASAGLGLIMASRRVPSYDLTVARGGVKEKIRGSFDALRWWQSVSDGPYAISLEKALKSRPLVLVCLSRAYAPFMISALETIPCERIRLFGAGLDSHLPTTLTRSLLPYDDRFESICPGTRSDFAQRILLHYATEIYGGPQVTLESDKAAIESALEGAKARPRGPKRPGADDAAIREIIKRLLPTIGKRRSVMLRHLRTVEGVACEQSRFNRLFQEVANK